MWEELDFDLGSGRVHAQARGPAGAPLVLCVHGLSANMHAFDYLGPRLADGRDRRLVAIELRGRGQSDATAPFGLIAHARDVLEVADALSAETFDYVGWSLGALIGIHVANREPARLRTLGLIDHGGNVGREAAELVLKSLDRLDSAPGSAAAYVEAIAARSPISPFTDFWRELYSYEYGPHRGRCPSADKAACVEDFRDCGSHDWPALWRTVTMPAALVRALQPIGGDFVCPPEVRDAMAAQIAGLAVTELDVNHYTVMTHAGTADALGALLD